MGEMASRTSRVECSLGKHIRHVLSDSIKQAFVFDLAENRFKVKELYSKKI